MKNFTIPVILVISALAVYPIAAQAQVQKDALKAEDTKPKVVKKAQLDESTIQKYNRLSAKPISAPITSDVPSDATAVRDSVGNIYYNRILAPSELTKVDFDVNVVDTYTYEYNGRIYTNKVTQGGSE